DELRRADDADELRRGGGDEDHAAVDGAAETGHAGGLAAGRGGPREDRAAAGDGIERRSVEARHDERADEVHRGVAGVDRSARADVPLAVEGDELGAGGDDETAVVEGQRGDAR